jgi:hypothetical protein
MGKTRLYINKPIYVGMTVLDISRLLIYVFHLNVMQRNYGDKCRVDYGDNDSLIYSVQTEDVYTDIKSKIDHFDTSVYKQNNPYDM